MYAILGYLENSDIRLPGGGILTPDYFLGQGIIFGMKGKSSIVNAIVTFGG